MKTQYNCPKCKTTARPSARFCINCGHSFFSDAAYIQLAQNEINIEKRLLLEDLNFVRKDVTERYLLSELKELEDLILKLFKLYMSKPFDNEDSRKYINETMNRTLSKISLCNDAKRDGADCVSLETELKKWLDTYKESLKTIIVDLYNTEADIEEVDTAVLFQKAAQAGYTKPDFKL